MARTADDKSGTFFRSASSDNLRYSATLTYAGEGVDGATLTYAGEGVDGLETYISDGTLFR